MPKQNDDHSAKMGQLIGLIYETLSGQPWFSSIQWQPRTEDATGSITVYYKKSTDLDTVKTFLPALFGDYEVHLKLER